MKNETLKLYGHIKGVDVKTGEVVFENHNDFVQLGLNEIAKLIAGQSAAIPTHCAVGTSNAPTSSTDTGLKGTQLGRKAFDSFEITDSDIQFVTTFGPNEAVGVWEETGIFTAEADGIMWSRALTGTYTKKEADEIKVFWTYKIKAGAN